jgi:hypothetical protein
VFVADLNNDDMVRGIQRHVLGDLACKVHRMAFGRAQVLELRTGTIRTKSQPLADIEMYRGMAVPPRWMVAITLRLPLRSLVRIALIGNYASDRGSGLEPSA